jgi:hypothetical protein
MLARGASFASRGKRMAIAPNAQAESVSAIIGGDILLM